MAKTKNLTIGKKTFEVRESVPYQIIDIAVREFDKLDKIDNDERRGIASLNLRNLIMFKMVVNPKMDEKYLADEADLDDIELSFDLLAEVAEAIESRFNSIKKKHPRLFDIKLEGQDKPGLEKIPS